MEISRIIAGHGVTAEGEPDRFLTLKRTGRGATQYACLNRGGNRQLKVPCFSFTWSFLKTMTMSAWSL
jgi:hypothetical protein